MNNLLIKIKNSDRASLLEALTALGGTLEYSYPGAKFSEFLVILPVDGLASLVEAAPSLEIMQEI